MLLPFTYLFVQLYAQHDCTITFYNNNNDYSISSYISKQETMTIVSVHITKTLTKNNAKHRYQALFSQHTNQNI